jgi:hypothetical protein
MQVSWRHGLGTRLCITWHLSRECHSRRSSPIANCRKGSPPRARAAGIRPCSAMIRASNAAGRGSQGATTAVVNMAAVAIVRANAAAAHRAQ